MTTDSTLTIRPARRADVSELAGLAAVDSQRPLTGDVLVAQTGDKLIAAVSLADGRTVADPFMPTAGALAVLRVRATQLRAARRVRRPALRRSSLRTASG